MPLTALTTKAKPSTVSLWGHVRPAEGKTKVTILAGVRSFTTYKTYTTDAHGYFTKSVPYVKGRSYRLKWTSPTGRVYTGTPTRVYVRP